MSYIIVSFKDYEDEVSKGCVVGHSHSCFKIVRCETEDDAIEHIAQLEGELGRWDADYEHWVITEDVFKNKEFDFNTGRGFSNTHEVFEHFEKIKKWAEIYRGMAHRRRKEEWNQQQKDAQKRHERAERAAYKRLKKKFE